MKPVDVLAVIDCARRTIYAQSKLCDDVMAHIADDVAQARDAVAELMQATRSLSDAADSEGWRLNSSALDRYIEQANAALRRCGGDA